MTPPIAVTGHGGNSKTLTKKMISKLAKVKDKDFLHLHVACFLSSAVMNDEFSPFPPEPLTDLLRKFPTYAI